jgi:hypothetical protein
MHRISKRHPNLKIYIQGFGLIGEAEKIKKGSGECHRWDIKERVEMKI